MAAKNKKLKMTEVI